MLKIKLLLLATPVVMLCQCGPPPLTGVRITSQSDPKPEMIEQTDSQSESSASGMSGNGYSVAHTEFGDSSWYSVKTNGGTQTASGIPFSDHKYTVAHKTLPFGTKVRVTNLRNGKSVVGTVTDRGPFIQGRIVDLSLVMARQIDAYHSGIAPCKLEVLRTR